MRYVCNDCGDDVFLSEKVDEWDCVICGGRVGLDVENMEVW